MQLDKPIVVNLYECPSTGKSRNAAGIFKGQGINCEIRIQVPYNDGRWHY